MKELRLLSKRNFVLGIINLIISIPIFFWALTTVAYISQNKAKNFNEYLLEFIINPWLMPIIILVLINTIADYLVYKDPKKIYLKKFLIVLNLIYFFSITIYSYNSPPIAFFIGFSCLFLYKTFRYYQYYKLATNSSLN